MNKAWVLLFRNQFLGFVREPAAAIFNLLVPLGIITLQAFAFGDTLLGDEFPGLRVADTLPVSAIVMFTLTIGLFGMSIGVASMIESRTIQGFSLRPGGVRSLLTAYSVVLLLVVVSGLTIAIGWLAFGWGIRAPSYPVQAFLVVLLSVSAFLCVGACIAALVGGPRSAQGASSAFFFPLFFLSGAMFPLDSFPDFLQKLAEYLPAYQMSELIGSLWVEGKSFDWWNLAYMTGFTVVFFMLAQVLFSLREDV